MINRLMMSVAAAALIAGTSGFANAQGMGREGGGAAGGSMQQSAPAASPSAGGHEGAAGMKSSQSEEKGGAANRSAQQDMKPGATKSGDMGEKSATEKSAQTG